MVSDGDFTCLIVVLLYQINLPVRAPAPPATKFHREVAKWTFPGNRVLLVQKVMNEVPRAIQCQRLQPHPLLKDFSFQVEKAIHAGGLAINYKPLLAMFR